MADPQHGSSTRHVRDSANTWYARRTSSTPSRTRTAPHRSAFLVGRISQVVPATAPEDTGRWMIQFSEYARTDQASVWTGDRNPVRYTTLDELGIDVDSLQFEKSQVVDSPTDAAQPGAAGGLGAGLTIREAKAGLAQTYGVGVDAIEIVIRG